MQTLRNPPSVNGKHSAEAQLADDARDLMLKQGAKATYEWLGRHLERSGELDRSKIVPLPVTEQAPAVADAWGGLSPSQFVEQRPPAEYADAEKIVQKREITAVVGQSGVGKSFWALDKAGQLADSVPVLYVAAEGMNPDRLLAQNEYRRKEGKPPLSDQLTIVDRVLDLASDIVVDSFVAYAATLKPEVVIIDTLAACTGDLDDNTKEAMQPVMNRIRERMIKVLNCAVVIIHHTNKDGKTYRGSTAIKANVTNMYYLNEEDELIILHSDKQRDSNPDPDRYYQRTTFFTRKHPVTGEDIHSAVMICSEKAIRDPRLRLSSNQKKVLEALDGFDQGVRFTTLQDATGLSKSSLHSATKMLIKAGFVKQSAQGEPYYITPQGLEALQNA